ncbi:MAG: invasion associated locus B family protein [Beijerinckiaceae bacterium]|nr:invasion associated locus B family protein [Beijerinckiaceae bacterium]
MNFQYIEGSTFELRKAWRHTWRAIAALFASLVCLACAPQSAAAQPAAAAETEVLKSETTKIRAWTVNCVTMNDAVRSRRCAARLTVTREGVTGPLLAWEIVLNPQRAIISALQIPTGVLIEPGIELRAGGTSVWRARVTACEPARCVAGFRTDEQMVRTFAANPRLEAVVKDLTGKDLVIALDVTGIDEAYATLTRDR